jgi:hypothetical protein
MKLLFKSSFLILVIVVAISAGISACDKPTGPERHCSDEDYPLWCADHHSCCPKGYPISYGGKCYTTESAARASCSASLDTCERDG